jgi:hypothetical protein
MSDLHEASYLKPSHFTYGQFVEVTVGFYRGCLGRIRDVTFFDGSTSNQEEYWVQLDLAGSPSEGSGMFFPVDALLPVAPIPELRNVKTERFSL